MTQYSKAQARKEIEGELTVIRDGFLDNETGEFYTFFDSRIDTENREVIDTYLDALVADLNERGGNWFISEEDPGIVAVM